MVYNIKKVYDVWVVLDHNGNEVEECPTKRDAKKFVDTYNLADNQAFAPE